MDLCQARICRVFFFRGHVLEFHRPISTFMRYAPVHNHTIESYKINDPRCMLQSSFSEKISKKILKKILFTILVKVERWGNIFDQQYILPTSRLFHPVKVIVVMLNQLRLLLYFLIIFIRSNYDVSNAITLYLPTIYTNTSGIWLLDQLNFHTCLSYL